MRFKNFEEVIVRAQKGQPVRVSVAAAHDEDVLTAIKQGVELSLIEPFFVGNKKEIQSIAEHMGFDIDPFEIYSTTTETETAYIAAKLADEKKTQIIMKGFINSTPFLKGVLHKDFKLKTDRILSHLSIFEIPGYERLLFMTDGGLNIAPDINQKEQILYNAIEFIHKLGVNTPKVAILTANERVNEKMPVTVEAHRLAQLASEGRFGSAIVEGPLPLDLAISKESLYHKGINSEVDGEADLFLVPTIEAGNILGKAITYFAKGIMAGVVLGAKVPLILNSRSDSAKAKLASIAISVVANNEK
ncbi:phosphate butyryltransferase [Vulcanibacillus modesticaldus]|uniref:Phosphate butyryltransferase n=1 Tax=Vulcanibacillus modesticaldus TaxID=337097 RepID=A0A1D2YT30_9BACI|nr:bifunctional enoyl-CoA hydratase/phosphate acetyltransferase [Vulcanibacillus modesticaldus]OEF98843.1 phosphate butyryltransferase [Vulcanibacillus modesticaldus]